MGEVKRWGVEYIELCVLSAQLFCTSKTMPKNKVYYYFFKRSLKKKALRFHVKKRKRQM